MLSFFQAAMRAPGRQLGFRQVAVMHSFAVLGIVYWLTYSRTKLPPEAMGYLALVLGLIEGAALIGWRLTQLPKSQALEFMLVSPVRPRKLFVTEWLVGCGRFLFVQLAAAPVWVFAWFDGVIETYDFVPYVLMPIIWGMATGLLLTTWIYEAPLVRRLGELAGLFGVLVYLVVGLLIGEKLKDVLLSLPDNLSQFLLNVVVTLHQENPFGLIRQWAHEADPFHALGGKFGILHGGLVVVMLLALTRAASRLQPHFQDRHYAVQSTDRASESDLIGERPLSWWAVRRVMEYSGRVNLWLAVGVALLYSAYVIMGDRWPKNLGTGIFTLFDTTCGPGGMAMMLCTLACVPAIYQYGLWDSTTQDRCRRLELLLLSELNGRDYAHAAFAAAWARGRGYFVGAIALWLAIFISGRNDGMQVLAAAFGAVVLYLLALTLGFRSFAKGAQTSGLASIFTLGLPIGVAVLHRYDYGQYSGLIPHGWAVSPITQGIQPAWIFGMTVGIILTIFILKASLRDCVNDLQRWYDLNHGRRSVE